ncbi:High affinity copper uptake protein 1 [Strongyloides ratti]|uniref:Copper transport protein n=1 Tax=Strongyloides ratti TaxID=34506 RepID=A0A090L320_STRRB|nr:High affinity copper uptake protein 1 [Strongyloides ratti]CEF62517.1 High affinity copper uptake protein 1 [Strongyloides ratti]
MICKKDQFDNYSPLVDHSGNHQHIDHSMHNNIDHSMHNNMDHSMHHNMDHSMHHGMDHSMKMWFHGGTNEVILFDCWRVNSSSGLIFSCIIIFFLASCYEGLKWFRVYLQTEANRGNLFKAFNKKNPKNCKSNALAMDGEKAIPLNTPCCGNKDCPENRSISGEGCQSRNCKDNTPCLRIILALLYVIQLTLAYCLMLITMTYNIYLGAAVVFGAGLGNYLFSGIKCSKDKDQIQSYAEDACH